MTLPRHLEDPANRDNVSINAHAPARADQKPAGGGSKPSNPKDAVGIKKVPWSVIPLPVLWELGVAMLEGALKYGRHNYRSIGVRASVYFDATVGRHLASWWEGEDIDPESGVHHITKAIASLTVLRDAMIRGNWVDDRPPKTDPSILAGLNSKAAALVEKYPVPKEAFTEQNYRGGKEENAAGR